MSGNRWCVVRVAAVAVGMAACLGFPGAARADKATPKLMDSVAKAATELLSGSGVLLEVTEVGAPAAAILGVAIEPPLGVQAVVKQKVEFSVRTSGTALALNGRDQFLELPRGVADLHDMSLVVTLKHQGGKPNQRLVEFAADTKTRMYLTHADESGRPAFLITKDGKTQTLRSSASIPSGKWADLALVLTGDTGILQIDGKTVAREGGITLNPGDLRATACLVGRGLDGDFFAGELEDVSIYSVPLVDGEAPKPDPAE